MTQRDPEVGGHGFRSFYLPALMSALYMTFSIPYLVPIARRIYGNPAISLARLNIILHKRMEAGSGLFDDKTKLTASDQWSGSQSRPASSRLLLASVLGPWMGVWREWGGIGSNLTPSKP